MQQVGVAEVHPAGLLHGAVSCYRVDDTGRAGQGRADSRPVLRLCWMGWAGATLPPTGALPSCCLVHPAATSTHAPLTHLPSPPASRRHVPGEVPRQDQHWGADQTAAQRRDGRGAARVRAGHGAQLLGLTAPEHITPDHKFDQNVCLALVVELDGLLSWGIVQPLPAPHPTSSRRCLLLILPSLCTLPPLQTVANNFSTTAWAFNKLLNVVNVAHSVLGATPIKAISSALNKATGHMVPEWNPYMPKVSGLAAAAWQQQWARPVLAGASCAWLAGGLPRQSLPRPRLERKHAAPVLQGAAPLNMNPPKPAAAERGVPRKVVYVPACVTRIMGPSKGDYETGEWALD